MGKKTWGIFGIICLVIITVVLVLMLILVPQYKASSIQSSVYEAVEKQEYTFEGKTIDTINKQYVITEDDVSSGKKTKMYEEGNINPFTPDSEVSIYNEPTITNKTTTSSTPLTSSSK